MKEKKLSTGFEETQKHQEEYFRLCQDIIAENDIDSFMTDMVSLLKKFKNEKLASFLAAFIWQAVAQAVKQTVEEQLKS